ncbi:MAG TPA: hypothetical protein VJJ79_02340 [Candidatus Nanoarchaeia archaeon]|nr:hypothetical protein [Candidatus Nanoarchaeia archaeon]
MHDKEYDGDDDFEEDLSTEEIAVAAYNKIEALIQLLIKKGIITEKEYDQMEDQLFWSEEEDGTEEESI